MCNKVVNNQIPSPRLGVSLLRENTNIFTNVSYLCILHICLYKIYNSVTLFKGKISYKILVWSQASLLLKELTIFIYFELINVFGIMRSCLLHNDFHSCLFLYSCMLQGSGGHVSCISMYRNICNCPTCATNNLHAACNYLEQGTHALVLHLPTACCQRRNPDPLRPVARFTKYLKPKIFLSAIQFVWHLRKSLA